jgi:hypothetical protein
MPQGVELIGTLNSKLNVDLFVFAEVKKEFTLDLSTGSRL